GAGGAARQKYKGRGGKAMNIGSALLALLVGFMASSGGAAGALTMWSGRRAGAAVLSGFGLASLLGSLAVLAFLFWRTAVLTWGMGLLASCLAFGLCGSWFVVVCRASNTMSHFSVVGRCRANLRGGEKSGEPCSNGVTRHCMTLQADRSTSAYNGWWTG